MKLRAFLSGFIALILLFVVLHTVNATQDKVTICHATDSTSNPYVVNQPNKSGDVSGHDGHNGPIFPLTVDGKWGDIIPPFDYGEGQHYSGKNWTTEGQAIYNNDCEIPEVTPTITPTVTPTPTPTI